MVGDLFAATAPWAVPDGSFYGCGFSRARSTRRVSVGGSATVHSEAFGDGGCGARDAAWSVWPRLGRLATLPTPRQPANHLAPTRQHERCKTAYQDRV
jgi:hypothetical protein